MRIAIRADASIQIGSGHVMRCLVLAEKLKANGAEVVFLCRQLPGNLIGEIQSKGLQVFLLPDTPLVSEGWRHDAEICQSLVRNWEADWLVVDHYQIGLDWHQFVRRSGCKIMAIDDLANTQLDCEIVLNQNLRDGSPYSGLVPQSSVVLMGLPYVLLREEFKEAIKVARSGVARNFLIFFGGSDATDETSKALLAFKKLNLVGAEINVVVGASSPHKEKVSRLCDEIHGCHYFCQIKDMASLMSKTDLALGAAGVASWERMAVGLPALVMAVADNQVENMRQLEKLGVTKSLGLSAEVSSADIAQALADIIDSPSVLRTMSERALGLVDCNGADRVAECLLAESKTWN